MVALALMAAGGVLFAMTADPVARASPLQTDEQTAGTSFLGRAHHRATVAIDSVFRNDAPMARALLVADQHEISPEMRDRYARAGIIHMLSISGLHVAIIASAVALLLQLARLPPAVASIMAIATIALYVALIGAPPPALRSAVMLAAVTASRITQRPVSPWAALALGAFVPLFSPRVVTELGYQLSVVGIAGLVASAGLSRRLLAPNLEGVKLSVSRDLLTSALATLVTAPLIAWHFGRISLIAPIANLAAGPVISVLQPMLFLALVLAPFPSVAQFVADSAHPLLKLFDGIAGAAASVPYSSISVVPSLVTAVAGGGVVVAVLCACLSRYPARPVVMASGAFALVAWSPAVRLPHHGGIEMHVLDVGQGDAVLIRSDRGRWILFDAGRTWATGDAGRSVIIPYVMRRGGDLTAFVLSHAHADHAGGAPTVLRALRPRWFWDAAFVHGSAVYDNSLRAARESGVEWKRVKPGESLQIDGVRVDFLAPDSAWTASLADPNDASTVALVQFGASRFLLVGDAEEDEERWLLRYARDNLRADVLKVGHHGSATSSGDEFLSAVRPSLALISVGAGNLYGHPSSDVLAALGRIGAEIARTDRDGTIVVRSDGRRITFETRDGRWDISRE